MHDYERNFNFRTPLTIDSPEINEQYDWPTEGYKQITIEMVNSLPEITIHQVHGYFLERMGLDNEHIKDSQALKKGEKMKCRVEACSMLVKERNTYISATCLAAMKKGVSSIVY